jgi:hypothetical protein
MSAYLRRGLSSSRRWNVSGDENLIGGGIRKRHRQVWDHRPVGNSKRTGGGFSDMALRIEEPDRLRAATVASLAIGLLLVDESEVGGPLAWIGIAVFCVGTALLDGLGEGRVGSRQAGLLLILAGIAATTWTVVVVLLTHIFLEEAASPALYVLLVGGVATLVGGGMLRRLPPGEAVLSTWTRVLRASVRSSEQSEAA